MRQAQVFYKNEFAGIIRESDEGFVFQYDREYLASALATRTLHKQRLISFFRWLNSRRLAIEHRRKQLENKNKRQIWITTDFV